jgi:hypothetical protein
MNERIKQLADEAGFMDSWFSESGDDCERELKKFAELIVQECIHALWTEECRINAMTQADYERSGNRIHKHFYGVE